MLTWTTAYEMGIAKVDAQHRELFEKVNELHDAMRAGRGREKLGTIIEFLKSYVVEHFRTEEELMTRYHFQGLEEHRREHQEFAADFARLEQSLQGDPKSFRHSVAMQQRLSDWLVKHVKNTDRTAMAFLVSKGAS